MPSESQQVPLNSAAAVGDRLQKLLNVLDRLRGPDGCPWDREQTSKSLIPYLLEETYEVIESIEAQNTQGLKEELGDLLLHVLFQCKIAEEQGWFSLSDSLESITTKLINRHPHVFGDVRAEGAFQAKQNWEAAKVLEKQRVSVLEGVPRQLPALTRARRIQEKAAYVGFDWERIEPVWEKVHEELRELSQAQRESNSEAVEQELGDVLFSLVNLGRFLGVSSEGALRRTIAKFEYRFHKIEEELRRRGKTPADVSLEEMDEIWNRYRDKEPEK